MHDDFADHAGVPRAAVLRAEQVIPAGLGRLEPQMRVAARDDVGLHPKRRNEDVVDDVFRRHDELHGAARPARAAR